MTFLSDESGIETSIPREGIELIVSGMFTYRVATGTRDLTIGGFTYTAQASQREAMEVSVVGVDGALIVTLPALHAVPRRWLAAGVPPQQVIVNVWRQQASGDVETLWRGIVTSVALDRHLAKLRVDSRMALSLRRRLPTLTAGRSCPHVLGDANCTVDLSTRKVATTVQTYNGRQVVVASVGAIGPFTRGALLHVPSGERMTVLTQTGNTMTLQLPIYGLALGDAVEITPGCENTITFCDSQFSNSANFGGFAQLPLKNPFEHSRTGLGVVEQT